MARYRHTDIEDGQGMFLTVDLKKQLLPETYEYMLDNLIGNRIDTSNFDINYNNDKTGAKAIQPEILIKLIIYSYSKGIHSSRRICELSKSNIIAKALSKGEEPHWTTIASFISRNSELFKEVFVKVLAYCAGLNLIGGETFAIDGCRLPSNASIELSGTKKELEKRLDVYIRMAEKHVAKHKRRDERGELDEKSEENYHKRQKKLGIQIDKISNFLNFMEKKEGKRGKEIRSNVTDNESAMIRTKTGYIQGYIGLAVADNKNQVIVSASAEGNTNEGEYLQQLLDDMSSNMENAGVKPPEDSQVVVMGDANYFSEENLEVCRERNIDAVIPDNQSGKRVDSNGKKRYDKDDFKYHEEDNYYECPNGKKLVYRGQTELRGNKGSIYQASVKDCRICQLSARCVSRKKDTGKIDRGRKLFISSNPEFNKLCIEMREKLNTVEYQDKYSYRIQIIEPVFAHIKYCKKLDRFNLRGREKVTGQWLLYCIVHNLWKCLNGYNKAMGFT